MKRYLILFNNGCLVQQRGLNLTYLQLHDLGVIKFIVDTETGQYLTNEKWEWKKITEYDDSSLLIDPIIENIKNRIIK